MKNYKIYSLSCLRGSLRLYALEIHELQKGFEGFSLIGVSFSVPPGTVMGFVGENGAEKSTTIKHSLI